MPTATKPTTCCGKSGQGCVCASQAKCSCGKQSAMNCSCEKAATENTLTGARCSCREFLSRSTDMVPQATLYIHPRCSYTHTYTWYHLANLISFQAPALPDNVLVSVQLRRILQSLEPLVLVGSGLLVGRFTTAFDLTKKVIANFSQTPAAVRKLQTEVSYLQKQISPPRQLALRLDDRSEQGWDN